MSGIPTLDDNDDSVSGTDAIAFAPKCAPPWVTVIGAGITGLTVAHELVERGFRVQVIEKASGSPADVQRSLATEGCCPQIPADAFATQPGGGMLTGCDLADVGGVARTQWALVPDGVCLDAAHDIPYAISLDLPPKVRLDGLRLGREASKVEKAIVRQATRSDAATVKALHQAVLHVLEQLSREKSLGQAAQAWRSWSAALPEHSVWSLLWWLRRVAEVGPLESLAVLRGALKHLDRVTTTLPALAPWLEETQRTTHRTESDSAPRPRPRRPPLVAARSVRRPPPPPVPIPSDPPPPTAPWPIAFDRTTGELRHDWDTQLLAWLGKATMVQFVRVRFELAADVAKPPSWADTWIGEAAASRRAEQVFTALERSKSEVVTRLRALRKLPATTVVVRLGTRQLDELRDAPDWFMGMFALQSNGALLVPAEHGYRFFAGFYRHLRDTMKRTPIFEPSQQRFSYRSVHDHLTEVRWQAVADPERAHPTAFPRKPVTSLTAARDMYRRIRRDLGYRPSDLMRFVLRMARVMTSSSERRAACYEDLTWWDFLSLRNLRNQPVSSTVSSNEPRLPYGRRFGTALRHSPQALVAMDGDDADARTQGNISTQLFMDNLGLHEQSDSTLVGPTSEAWFQHWKRYLEHQGVKFFAAEVHHVHQLPNKAITIEATTCNGAGAMADLSAKDADGEPQWGFYDPSAHHADGTPHYVVLATDVVAAADVTTQLPAVGALKGLHAFTYPGGADPRDLLTVGLNPGERFQTLTGIQLFYSSKVSFADAHIYYAQSAWGLSAVSQFQYWNPYLDDQENKLRLLGNLSLDIGNWRSRIPVGASVVSDGAGGWKLDTASGALDTTGWLPSERAFPPSHYGSPNDLTRGEIADGVEAQIIECLGTLGGQNAPWARFYHLDDLIGVDASDKPITNDYPFLINLVSDWNNRPHAGLWSPLDGNQRFRIPGNGSYVAVGTDPHAVWHQGGYPVHFDSLVLAGTYMRTYTRLGTMEAANESGRHAVNAILDHLSRTHATAVVTAPTPPYDEPSPIAPQYLWTPFGDYCSIWDVEQHEVDDLRFLKLVDRYLFAKGSPAPLVPTFEDDVPLGKAPAGAPNDFPHLFDLLDLDVLPDMIDDDADALRVFDVLQAGLEALKESDALDDTDLARAVERIRSRVRALIRTP